MRGMGNRRGATIAVAAVVMLGTMSIIALAFDLGIMFRTHTEAQRAADAAALAGASAYMEGIANDAAVPEVIRRAKEFAGRNTMETRAVDSATEVRVFPIPDSAKVRVYVRRAQVRTVFARLFGVTSLPIGAKAAAIATDAVSVKCVKPWAIPDLWDEATSDSLPNNDWPDVQLQQGGRCRSCEDWTYNPASGDRYCEAGSTSCDAGQQTGIGSTWRNDNPDQSGTSYDRDHGRQFPVKLAAPNATPAAGNFFPFRLPDSQGGNDYRTNIRTCSTAEVPLGTPFTLDGDVITTEPGNMIGPTSQGVNDLIAQDRQARWDPTMQLPDGRFGGVNSPNYRPTANNPTAWLNSPRVAIIPLFSPDQISNGMSQLAFTRFAYFFIEDFDNQHKAVIGRYIDIPVSGSRSDDDTETSNAKVLRLVE